MKKNNFWNKPRWSFHQLESIMLPGWILLPGYEEHKRIAVIGYLTAVIAVVALVIIGIWRIFYHEEIIGWINFSFALVLAAILAWHCGTKKSHNYLALYVGIAAFAVFLFCILLLSKYDNATYLWSYLFPLMAFPLAGSRRGAIFTLLFLIPITLMLVWDPFSFLAFYPQDFKYFYIPSLLAVAALSYVYERNRERNQHLLNQTNAALLQLNEEMELKIRERTAELTHSEEKYRFLTDRMIDIVFTADMHLNLTYVSPSVRNVLGYEQEEYLRLPFHERVTPESLNKAFTIYAVEIEREKLPGVRRDRNLVVELENRHKNGSTVWSEVAMTGIRDKDGNLIGVHGVSRDITDRKQKERDLRKQSERLRELSAKIAETEETERRRIARELHDQAGQNLAALGLNLKTLQSLLPEGPPGAVRKRLEESLALLDQTAEFLRDLMGDLRPPVMDDYGLGAAIRWYGKKFTERTGIEFTLREQENVLRPDTRTEMTLYRIFQEAMINTWKHARAEKVDVSLEIRDNRFRLTVFDNGTGFDLSKMSESDRPHGWGLTTMAERAEAIGADFSMDSRPGQGTKITVEAAV